MLVGWFYGMSNFVGLFYAKVSLKVMVSNYIFPKSTALRSMLFINTSSSCLGNTLPKIELPRKYIQKRKKKCTFAYVG